MTLGSSEAVGRWMERYRLQFIAVMALSGLLIVLLSLAPWVQFRSVDAEGVTPTAPKAEITVNGTSLSRWRDDDSLLRNDPESVDGWCSCHIALGDGYLTAVPGGILVIAAAIALARRVDRPMAIAGTFAAVGTFVVSAYNAFGEWNAYVWTPLQTLEITKGEIQPALYALVAASVIAAIASGLLWGAEEVHDEMLEEEDAYSDLGGARWV